jgi:hypothetical protein
MGGSKSFSYVMRRSVERPGARRVVRGRIRAAVRGAAVAACLIAPATLITGCGNTRAVCADTQKTLEDLAAKARTLPPDNTVQWKQAMTDVAGRLDALSRRADDGKLKTALRDTAASYRAAATGMDRGDTAALSAVIRDQPRRLDQACH